MPLLQNEVICITGASRGVGECLAHCLAEQGVKKLILVAEEEQGLKTASGAGDGLGWEVRGRRRNWHRWKVLRCASTLCSLSLCLLFLPADCGQGQVGWSQGCGDAHLRPG